MAFSLTATHAASSTTLAAVSQAYGGGGVTSGNLLTAIVTLHSTGHAVSTPIADTVGSTWHQAYFASIPGGPGLTLGIWWAIAAGTGANTVTLTWNVTGAGEIDVAEFSGTSVVGVSQDGAGVEADGTAATILVPSITTANADDLLLGYANVANSATIVAPWNLINTVSGNASYYQADLGPGAHTPDVTQTSGVYANVLVALGAPAPALALGRGSTNWSAVRRSMYR